MRTGTPRGYQETTLLKVSSGERVRLTPEARCALGRVQVAPDGKALVVGCAPHQSHQIALEQARSSPARPGELGEPCLSPDGKWIAVRDGAKWVRVLTLASAREALLLECGPSKLSAVGFSPDGGLLYTGGEDGNVVAWDLAALRGR